MKVGFCQFEVTYKDIEANLRKIEDLLMHTRDALIVLPELCFSGYYFNAKEELYGLSDEGCLQTIVSRLQNIALERKLYLVAGLAEKEGLDVYNSCFVIGAEGVIAKHRKVNLTRSEGAYARGKDFEIFRIGNVKVGIVICFESWFPESFRILARMGAQVICCPANFGGHWTPDVIKTRSLENKVFTVLANRTGTEMIEGEEAVFRGESQVVDYEGMVLVKAGKADCVMTVEVDPHTVSTKDNMICEDMMKEQKFYNKYIDYHN